MEGKGRLQRVILTACLLVAAGCVGSICEDETVMLKVGFSGVDFAVKAIDPVEDKLTDVSLLVFDSNGDAEMCMYAVDGAEGFEVPLVVGRRYSFRACANFGYQVYSDNLKELDELRCYLAYPDEYSEGIPMCAALDDVLIGDGSRAIELPLRRLMAKVSLRVDRGGLSDGVDMRVRRVTVGNCPRSVQVFMPGGTRSRHDCFPVGFTRDEYEVSVLNDGFPVSGSVELYLLENLQGRFSGKHLETDSDKVFGDGDSRGELCSYVEMELDYLSRDRYSYTAPLKYRFYLGGSRDDLDVERNCLYDIVVIPEDDGLGEDGWRIDKSGIGLFVKEIRLSEKSLSLDYLGQQVRLSAEVLPSGAACRDVYWESDDASVASVDQDGLVKAVGEGRCNISCMSVDGAGVEAVCTVAVKSADGWFRSFPDSYVRGNIGDRVHLWCEFYPPNVDFDIGVDELESDRREGIYTYEIDPDGHGVTLTLTGPGRGIVYMEAGPPLDEAAMWVVEVNLPETP